MKTDYKKLIVSKLKRSGKKPVRYKELLRDCKRKHFDIDKFNDTVASMKRTGEITETKFGFSLGEKRKERSCKVVRINRTFGFVQWIISLQVSILWEPCREILSRSVCSRARENPLRVR